MDSKELINVINNDCHMLREQAVILRLYYITRHDDIEFDKIAKNTNDFWIPVLKAIDDAMVVRLATILGSSKVKGVDQVSFALLFEKKHIPYEEEIFKGICNKYDKLIKVVNNQRNKYSAHRYAGKSGVFEKNFNELLTLTEEMKTLSENLVSKIENKQISFNDGKYAEMDFKTIVKRLVDSQKYYRNRKY